ncbi:unnamed protein product [Caenorhabditis sp. 36 PRJEB53466]|nr:unnamed protein product [Caenorhabditis sp. 36 PRJEB53466]
MIVAAAEKAMFEKSVNMGSVGENHQSTASASVKAPTTSVFEEDTDSRDSGISMGSCGGDGTTSSAEATCPADTSSATMAPSDTDFSKAILLEHLSSRPALTDCSNFVAKVYNSSVSSSRSSSFYHCDTPTGRKVKSVFSSDAMLDRSQFEKKSFLERTMESLNRKRSSSSMSPSCSLMDRKRSRNLSLEAPQSDRICRYNGVLKQIGSMEANKMQKKDPFGEYDGEEDEEDEVFAPPIPSGSLFVAPIAPRPTASLWDLNNRESIGFAERKTSDTSANGSFSSMEKMPKPPMRAMSVGVIDAHDAAHLPAMLEVKYSLPSVERPQKASQAYRSISAITLLAEFQRLGDSFEKQYVLIDCRYPYEFRGGHVRGAINLYKRAEIKAQFFPDDPIEAALNKRIPIFYCEFSQKRGPTMANAVRSIDRVRNELRYPHVEYPEMYLLDHGYKSLWGRRECRQICEPCNYVPMDHKEFTAQLKTARLERHRSNAAVKPNGEADLEEKWSMRTRSSARRKSSVLSLQSKFSQSSSTLSTTSEMMLLRSGATIGGSKGDDVFFMDNELEGPKKSVSAFDIQSIASSEVDLDYALIRRKRSTATLSQASSIQHLTFSDPFDDQSEQVVQLGLKVYTPDFPQNGSPPQDEYLPLGLGDRHHNTPRLCLDFSTLSDTE